MRKKTITQVRSCFQCSNAYLMRSASHNPIVSECSLTGERNVANTPIKCQRFKQRISSAEINPMKPCKL